MNGKVTDGFELIDGSNRFEAILERFDSALSIQNVNQCVNMLNIWGV